MGRVGIGARRSFLILLCLAATAGTVALLSGTSAPVQVPPAAAGPTGRTGPVDTGIDPRTLRGPRTLRNEAAAKRDVGMLLGLVRVPPGSRQVRMKITTGDASAPVDRADGTWKVHLPVGRVLAFEKAHEPRGSSFAGPSWGAKLIRGRMMRSPGLMFDPYPSLPGIPSRELGAVNLQELPGGWTEISADVRDYWTIERSPSEKLPGGVRAIVIHGPPRFARRVTRREPVARIVHWFDSVGVAQTPGYCGPGLSGGDLRLVRIDFLGADEKALASARFYAQLGDDGDCNPIAIRIRGRSESPLDGGGMPIDRIEQLAR